MKKFFKIINLVILFLFSTMTIFFSSSCKPDYPESRTFIVADQKSYNKIFVDNFNEFEIDFDKEMIVVYTFVTHYILPVKITDVELSGSTLTVNYNIELISGAGSARAPFQRWLLVKLDKLNITTVENSVSEADKVDEKDTTKENLAYNAKLFDEHSPDCTWIKENFQKKNRVKGAVYY